MVLILVVGASMRMYLLHRNSNYTEDFGAVDVADRVFAANGTVTDYPFDRYISVLTFDVTDANGVALPVAVSIWSRDPFFRNTPAAASQAIRRSAR
ncbi:Uncharacterised protein [Mycobacteroides abscessus subsp. abscessus]|nr:Uncharacterised protein [Mycobacteroides abscessus subsp. abscessus]